MYHPKSIYVKTQIVLMTYHNSQFIYQYQQRLSMDKKKKLDASHQLVLFLEQARGQPRGFLGS